MWIQPGDRPGDLVSAREYAGENTEGLFGATSSALDP